MHPVDPTMDSLTDLWRPVIYQQNDPRRTALAALQEVRRHRYMPGFYVPYRVVTVWAPDATELLILERKIHEWRNSKGPKPCISVMAEVDGSPLQSVRIIVGEFTEPYRRAQGTAIASPSAIPYRRRAV